MIPIWLHFLAIVCLVTGLICAVWIAIDETRHPQHMWIINLVWRITPLYGTVFALWLYYAYGRSAHRMAHASKRRGDPPPGKKLTPFPITVAKGALHCGSGCAIPWQWLHTEKR